MRMLISALALAAALLLMPAAGLAAELQESEIRTRAHIAWQERKFAELDSWATEYRTKRSTTSDGTWHMLVFYQGLRMAFEGRNADEPVFAAWNDTFKAWTSANPNSPTPYVQNGWVLVRQAWEIRGNKVASEVWPEDWKRTIRMMGS